MKSLRSMTLIDRNTLVLLIVLSVTTLLGSVVATNRNIDGDEGFYTYASRLTVEGQTPYLDFFYPQMPGLPYLYGLWMELFGFSWQSGRFFSIFLYALSTLLLSHYLRRSGHNWLSILFLSGLYWGNGLVLAWVSVIKPFALSLLILVATFVLLIQGIEPSRSTPKRRFWLSVAGLVLGLGIEIRLMLLPIPAFVILWIIRQSWHRGVKSMMLDILAFTSGILVSMLPALWLYLQSPWPFIFNNVGYHLRRHGQLGTIYDFPQKIEILKQLLALRQSWPLLIASALGLAVAYYPRRREKLEPVDNSSIELALLLLIALALICWLVTPSFTQYFCLLVPFAVVLISPLVRWSFDMLSHRWQFLIVVLLLGTYLAAAQGDMLDEIKRVGADAIDVSQPVVNEVTQFITKHTEADAVIISWWPGYLFTNQRTIYPGMENHFSRGFAKRVSLDEGISLEMATEWTRIASNEEILSVIAEGKADMVVVGIWQHRIGKDREKLDQLLAEQYTLAKTIYTTNIYLRNSK